MKILVTGGAGFIGSQVVDALINRDEEVIIIDNLSTGSEKNINSKAIFYRLDINSGVVEEIFKAGIDIVIHLAAQISVPLSLKDSVSDARSNIMGSLNLIELAKNYQVQKFIYINSAAIFGSPQYLPLDEEHARNPESNYGISKNVVEQYLKISGLNYVSLRLANVYGPRQISGGEGGGISIFINNLLTNSASTIEGDGTQTRDFIFVKDVVNAILCAMEKGDKECFNIGSGQRISINELFNRLSQLTNTAVKPRFAKRRAGDIAHSVFKIDKALEKLEWGPETELEAGLLETMKYGQEKFKKLEPFKELEPK